MTNIVKYTLTQSKGRIKNTLKANKMDWNMKTTNKCSTHYELCVWVVNFVCGYLLLTD